MSDCTFTLRFTSAIEDADELSTRLYEKIDDASLMGPARRRLVRARV
jgi:hypothetical protein